LSLRHATLPRMTDANSIEPEMGRRIVVTLDKPRPDSKIGVRLSGSKRPFVASLHADGLAAQVGCLQTGDVILSVNGEATFSHEETTALLRMAQGHVSIEIIRVSEAEYQQPASHETALGEQSSESPGAVRDMLGSQPEMDAEFERSEHTAGVDHEKEAASHCESLEDASKHDDQVGRAPKAKETDEVQMEVVATAVDNASNLRHGARVATPTTNACTDVCAGDEEAAEIKSEEEQAESDVDARPEVAAQRDTAVDDEADSLPHTCYPGGPSEDSEAGARQRDADAVRTRERAELASADAMRAQLAEATAVRQRAEAMASQAEFARVRAHGEAATATARAADALRAKEAALVAQAAAESRATEAEAIIEGARVAARSLVDAHAAEAVLGVRAAQSQAHTALLEARRARATDETHRHQLQVQTAHAEAARAQLALELAEEKRQAAAAAAESARVQAVLGERAIAAESAQLQAETRAVRTHKLALSAL